MKLTINTDFGEYTVPENVRAAIWDKIRHDGAPDRRFAVASLIDLYFTTVAGRKRCEWEGQ